MILKLRAMVAMICLVCLAHLSFSQTATLVPWSSGYDSPVDITNAGDDRMFVVEQDGRIKVVSAAGVAKPGYFLNIASSVGSGGNEQGLLGLAFHPDYENNGYFYVNYTDNSGNTKICRFEVSATNPDSADAATETLILSINQDFSNHNGGCIKFGPDGYLYIGMGDGGSGGDPNERAQDGNSLLGKMLRIDVDGGTPYAVPADNPFVGVSGFHDEIWAYGVRNPWRFSFDRLTGDMWIGDVGQNAWEEIDFQPADSDGGENYGWDCWEGDAVYETAGCGPVSNYVFPVVTHPHGAFGADCSITGGYVYRGSLNPDYYGTYFHADYCSGRIYTTDSDGMGGWINATNLNGDDFEYTTFGEDYNGELYIVERSGAIFRIEGGCPGFATEPSSTPVSSPGGSDGTASANVVNGNPGFNYLWSNGATTETITGLIAGTYSVTVTDATGCVVTGSVEVTEVAGCDNTTVVSGITSNPTPSGTGVALSWDAVPGATGYQLKGRIQGTTAFATITAATNFKNVGGLTPGTCYEWKLRVGCDLPVTIAGPFNDPLDVFCTPAAKSMAMENELNIHPNPASDNLGLTFNAGLTTTGSISIVDLYGKVILEESVSFAEGRNYMDYNISDLPSGNYFVKALIGNEFISKQFTIAK